MHHMIKANRETLTKVIDNYVIGYKSKRNRELLKDRLIDGLTFEEIAEKYGMSVRQIKKITYENEELILKHL